MSTFHIIIQQERRTPVVKERRVYLGEYFDTYELDENGGECLVQHELEPDNFEIVRDEDRSRLAIKIGTSVPTGNIINDMPEYVAGPVQLHIMATRAEIYRGRIKNALANGLEEIALILQEQAAMGVVPDFSDLQYVGVFEWDGKSPYVIQHNGDYSARTMGYAGWPEITKEEWDKCDSY